jgi:hypothetical protein
MRSRLKMHAKRGREVVHLLMHSRQPTRPHPRNRRVAAAFNRERRARRR